MKTISLLAICLFAFPDESDDIQKLRSVGEFASGIAAARQAADNLQANGTSSLLPILRGFQGSPTLAINWLRSTFEAIADAELKAGRDLPKGDLLAFIQDTKQHPSARRLAYEWLLKRSPQLKEELIPQMLLDPSPEFRRDAVNMLLEQAEKQTGNDRVSTWQKALTGAVHEDQVAKIAAALKEQNVEINVQEHFGFLPKWHMIGPFDNKEEKGFAVAYPPENGVNLDAEYQGQLGLVKWQSVETTDEYGVFSIAEEIKNYKGSLMYATSTWNSPKDQTLELRLGTPNAWKLWVNGKLVFQREEYHRSTRMDQYQIPVPLKAGENRILLKVCQNEQEQSWAQRYQFQLRICDKTGSRVASAE